MPVGDGLFDPYLTQPPRSGVGSLAIFPLPQAAPRARVAESAQFRALALALKAGRTGTSDRFRKLGRLVDKT